MKPLAVAFLLCTMPQVSSAQPLRFAVIGDYGDDGQPEADVAMLVQSWNVDYVITVGDNNYPNGEAATIDTNIGQYYHPFISPYTGVFGQGDTVNRFFPSLGNHDWNTTGALPYRTFFTLPGNERYYDFVRGDVHFFALDSDGREPDGNSATGVQAQWLRSKLRLSTSRWKVVYFHHPPYSSGSTHGSQEFMQWPFEEWGASVVLAGHEHNYERLVVNGFTYTINGLGGRSLYGFGPPIEGSVVRFAAEYGAQLIHANEDSLALSFITRTGGMIDYAAIFPAAPSPASPPNSADSQSINVTMQWDQSDLVTATTVQVATDSFFSTIVVDVSGVPSTSYQTELPSFGTTYYWRVRGFVDSLKGAWSAMQSFTTEGVVGQYSVSAQWNLVSLPLATPRRHRADVFPSATSQLFEFDSQTYATTDSLHNGSGYWLKFDSAETVSISGIARNVDTVAVNAGWNIVGTVSIPIEAISIPEDPPDIIISDYFSYAGTYQPADTLLPGKAYWVKSASAGSIILMIPATSKR